MYPESLTRYPGYNRKAAHKLRKKRIKEEYKREELEQKLLHLTFIQLQILSREFSEIQMLSLLRGTKNYKKLNQLRYEGSWEEYKMELATELALQLSGLA